MGTMLYLSLSGAVSFCERDYSPFPLCGGDGLFVWNNSARSAYRTFRVGFYTDEVRHCLVSSVFYLFSKKIKGGQNELVKSPKMIAMTALIRVISFLIRVISF